MSANLESFYGILRSCQNTEIRPSLTLLLAWITVCDEPSGTEKSEVLTYIANTWNIALATPVLLQIARNNCLRSIQLASEIVRARMVKPNAIAIIELFVRVAISDNYLSISENLILRYIARLISSDVVLKRRYMAMTGHALPAVGDPSSLSWWSAYEGTRHEKRSSRKQTNSEAHIDSEKLRALFVLGLDEGATADDIHRAYLRLSHVHHPDKFHASGPEAVEAANESFKRINAAFELLKAK